jgi:hypothetical protein
MKGRKMKKGILSIIFAIILFTTLLGRLFSQDKSENHFFEMNFIQVSYDELNDFLKFYDTYGKPMDADNEYILSIKIFRHYSGPMWSICFVTEYNDAESFVKAGKKGDEIFMKMFPDESKRNEVMKKWGGYLKGHTDALVTDNPKLEKK